MRPLILTLSLLPACLLRPVPGDSESTTTTSIQSATSTTTDPLPIGSTSPTTTTTSATDPLTTSIPDTAASTGIDFIIKPDGSDGPQIECDGHKQLDPECRPDQKCTINGSYAATHCVDVVGDPHGLYEPCTVMGDGLGGLDDCDVGLICWDTSGLGRQFICIGLCDGPIDTCDCADPLSSPFYCQECAVGFCFPGCDPLVQDCPGTDLCLANGGGTFSCVLDASGDEGQTNDPCEFANTCDKGLDCLHPADASSTCTQDAPGCCQPFCDLGDPGPCPNPDQACVQWIDPWSGLPSKLENIGVCRIPP